MLPAIFPHDLRKKPQLQGEADVFAALQAGLGDDWFVFYDRPVKGTRRRVDFLCIAPARGVLAIEVKGGMVHAARGWFRQLINKGTGQRKRIDPFGQLKLGVRASFEGASGDLVAALSICAWRAGGDLMPQSPVDMAAHCEWR